MAHADNVRRYFPATRHVAYLNTGTFGAMPDVAAEAIQESVTKSFTEGRTADYFLQVSRVKQRIREQLGHLLSADPRCFALTDSTTSAMNLVMNGLNLRAGDEVIVTDSEYPGAMLCLFAHKQQSGVVIRVVDGTLGADDLLSSIEAQLNGRTRLVVASHVTYDTGFRMPIEALAKLVHRENAYLLVDGAQGAGADALDLTASNVDFYALPGQKWLCGPDGTGALYIAARLWSVLNTTQFAWFTLERPELYNFTGSFLTHGDARKFEHTSVGLDKWRGWLEALQFLRVTVGWDFVFSRVKGMSGNLLEQLLDVDAVRILTSRDQRAGLVAFQIKNVSPETFVQEAATRAISIRSIADRHAVRVSTACYNNEDDIARVVQLLRDLVHRSN